MRFFGSCNLNFFCLLKFGQKINFFPLISIFLFWVIFKWFLSFSFPSLSLFLSLSPYVYYFLWIFSLLSFHFSSETDFKVWPFYLLKFNCCLVKVAAGRASLFRGLLHFNCGWDPEIIKALHIVGDSGLLKMKFLLWKFSTEWTSRIGTLP